VLGDHDAVRACKAGIKETNRRWPDGMLCVYYNAEKQYDKSLVKKLGIDLKKLKIVQGTIAEDISVNLEALMGVAHLHVIDSVSSTVALDEIAGDVKDWHMGLKARVWGKILRRCEERFDHHDNAVVLIDQVRDVFGSQGGEQPPGGKAIEHASSMTISFKKNGWLFRKEDGTVDPDATHAQTLSGMPEPEGMVISARVQKSRVGRPFRSARMHLDFETMAFDTIYELAKAAKHFGIVETSGGWYKLGDGSKPIQGMSKFRKHLEGDLDLQHAIIDKMMLASRVV
jgi:recombination protein RecA